MKNGKMKRKGIILQTIVRKKMIEIIIQKEIVKKTIKKNIYPEFIVKKGLKYHLELSRKLIGFITTGLYDYSLNKGKARGFIKVQEYEKLCALKQKFNMNFMPILLRKKDSLVYYLCSICFH